MSLITTDRLNYFWNGLKEKLNKIAFTGNYEDLNNKPVIPDISEKASKSADLGNCTFYRSGNDFYIRGADSVTKKLGSLSINRVTFGSNTDLSSDTTTAVITVACGTFVDKNYNSGKSMPGLNITGSYEVMYPLQGNNKSGSYSACGIKSIVITKASRASVSVSYSSGAYDATANISVIEFK